MTMNQNIILDKNPDRHIQLDLTCNNIIIDKSNIGETKIQKLEWNVLTAGRKNQFVHKMLVELANSGYYLVDHDKTTGVSTYHKLYDYDEFLSFFDKSRNVNQYNGVYYSLETPTCYDSASNSSPRLFVLFSSIADFPLNANVSRRTFFMNWPKVANYLPSNTFILRIADLGGIVASFYSNNNFCNDFESKIQNLLKYIIKKIGVEKSSILLYGVSKGGTGALLHSLIGKYPCLAVDPIVSDEFYLNRNDQHYVRDVFPESKDEKFKRNLVNNDYTPYINIITSERSEQYQYISSLLKDRNDISVHTINHPNIKHHPDVGRWSLCLATTLINSFFYKLSNNIIINTKF